MKLTKIFAWILSFVLWAVNVSAYEVWMGTHLVPGAMATDLASWRLTASQLDGVNINLSSNVNDPASTAERRTIFTRFAHASPIYTELARTNVTIDPALTDELAFPKMEAALDRLFSNSATYGYPVEMIMFYDNAATYQGTSYNYNWTTVEVQHLRDWLDANGHANVLLAYDARNNSSANRAWCVNPLVDHVVIEASTTELLGNLHSQITLLQWFWTNPLTASKKIILQIPRTENSISQYAGTRRVLQMLGTLLGYGEDGVRSSRLVILPVTYNDNYPYVPEMVSGGASYANNLTSICLSLLEQRKLFEGRLTSLPTVADADSLVRQPSPTVSPIPDQVVSFDTSTGPLAFNVSDDVTAASALTLSAASSNITLAPVANILFGGSSANRTVTATPASGQSGSAIITISVSNGVGITTAKFRLTVLPAGVGVGTLYSTAADSGITEVPAIENKSASTSYCGDSGTSPWVNRCIVYVFQLPNWGPVPAPFSVAGLTFNLADINGTPADIDLYGLGRRATAMVLTSDYYGQTAVPDPSDATRLQASILTSSTSLGLISTAPAGNTALVNYLNVQYAGGGGAGQYVFLRLNTTGAKAGIARVLLTLSEGGVAGDPDTRPRITYTAATNNPPTITPIATQSINVNSISSPIAFTVGDVETSANALTLTKGTSDAALVPSASIVLGGIGANRIVTITPAANKLGTARITLNVNDGTATTSSSFILNVTGTAAETWRFANFGTTANSGTAADPADPNKDGESNLLEFATGQNPNASGRAKTPLVRNGNALEFTYPRSIAAMVGGVTYTVEWSDTLGANSWSSAGVTEQIITDNGTVQTVKAACPAGTNGKRFVCLQVAGS